MNYRYLLFDADNTLFDFDKCEKEAFLSLSDLDPIAFNDSTFVLYHKINDELWKKAEKGMITKAALKTERFRLFFNSIGICIDDQSVQNYAKEYVSRLSCQNVLVEGAYGLLEYLYTYYDIYIITNGLASVQRKRFANSSINKFIKGLFISEEIGYDKPDVRYFIHVMSSIGSLDTSDYLIIGDSLSSDIKGAENAEIDSVYFNKSKVVTYSPTSKYNICSLGELKLVL